jgi:hypothetical protein
VPVNHVPFLGVTIKDQRRDPDRPDRNEGH